MNDKEIIIDGVNVAGCEAYGDTTFNFDCIAYCLNCKDKPNCYYKQLQRKEQECKKLREANDEKNEFLQKLGISATGEFHRIKHYVDKLHQECEELKAEIHRLNSFTDMEKELWIITEKQKQKINELKNNLAIANSNHEAAEEELDRYIQALEKIEEILKYYANSTLGELQPNGTYRYLLNQSPIKGEQYLYFNPLKAQEGLKIINEVKDE